MVIVDDLSCLYPLVSFQILTSVVKTSLSVTFAMLGLSGKSLDFPPSLRRPAAAVVVVVAAVAADLICLRLLSYLVEHSRKGYTGVHG